MSIEKRYLIAGREGVIIPEDFRGFLISDLRLYHERSIFQKSGGRSGDLGEETIRYEVFMSGSEGGRTRGAVHVYTVTDDSCNGFAQCWSVLIDLPPEDGKTLEILMAFLDDRGFANKHQSFKERPMGYKSYVSYLDAPSDLSVLGDIFRHPRA